MNLKKKYPIPRPGWYEFFLKNPIPRPGWYDFFCKIPKNKDQVGMNLKKKTQYQDQAGMFTSEIGTIPRLVSTRYRGHILQQYCNKIAETRVSTEDHIPRSNHS